MSEVAQGPAPRKKTLVETVGAILREDISIPFKEATQLRQPPINEDDHDSWAVVRAGDSDYKKWDYVAESVIRAIDRYRSRNGEA